MANYAETYVAVTDDGIVEVAIGCPTAVGNSDTTAAAYYAFGTVLCACWVCCTVTCVAPVPVMAPLEYVTAHVIQAERIGWVAPHVGCVAKMVIIVRLSAV